MAKEKQPKPEKAKKEKKGKVMTCPSCEMEIPKKAKICPRCGKALPKKKKSPLAFILPVLLLVVAALVSVVVFAFPVGLPIELPFGLPIKLTPKLSDTVLGEAMELTEKQEKAVLAVLESCGFEEVVAAEQLPTAGKNQAYTVQDAALERFTEGENTVVKIDGESKEVLTISFRSKEIYANGEVISQLSDHYLGQDDRDVYMDKALEEIQGRLDLPETAVFPSRSKWEFREEGEQVIVQSSVTAKNTSGVETQFPFEVVFENQEIVSVKMGETEDGE